MTVATTAQSHRLRIGATLSGPNAQTESREKDTKVNIEVRMGSRTPRGLVFKDPAYQDPSNRIVATCYDLDGKTMPTRRLGDKPILINNGKTLESPDLLDFY